MKIQSYSIKGVSIGEVTLPKEFDQKISLKVLAQAIHVYEERVHIGLNSTKTRSEINRTTKKVYKQKGTGGARHGSRRANLFVGGGIIFGPRPVKRVLTLSDKLKVRAKFIAYALKAKESKLVAVEGIEKIEKTKTASEFIKALGKLTSAKRFTFVISEKSKNAVRSVRNLSQANAIFYKNANAFDIYSGGMIVMDKGIFETKNEDQKVKSEKVVEAKKVIKKTVKKVAKKETK
jgi:large subunit ribosomal protein L4